MCLGIPGEVVELYDDRPDLAKVDVSGVRRAINIGLLEGDERPQVGDWILIHVGFALSKIDEKEAACGSSTNSATPRRPGRCRPASPPSASRGGSTSSWRCAEGTPTPSTS